MNHHNYQESSASDANLPPDTRYPPHNHSVMATSTYGYQQYPSHSYDNQSTQYQHTPLPPIRSSSSQAQASQSSSHHQTPSSYQSNYPSTHYPITPASHPWPEEPWSNTPHAQSFSPSQQESAFDSARSEAAPSPRVDPRAYSQSYYNPVESGRQSQGHHSRSPDEDMQQHLRGKEREREPPAERYPYPQTDSRPMLVDYKNLFSQCRDLLSQTTFMGNNTDAVGFEHLDRMHQNASKLLRTLNAGNPFPVVSRPNADDVIPENRAAEPADQPPKKQHKPEPIPSDAQKCLGCGATSTPEWRRGPLGPRTLCNACGLVYAKLIKKRSREIGAQPLSTTTAVSQPPQPPPPPIQEEDTFLSTAEGGTDDENSLSYDTDR